MAERDSLNVSPDGFVAEPGERTVDMIARLTRQTVADLAEHADIGVQAAHMWLEGLGNGYDLRVQHP